MVYRGGVAGYDIVASPVPDDEKLGEKRHALRQDAEGRPRMTLMGANGEGKS